MLFATRSCITGKVLHTIDVGDRRIERQL
jgi:hypothetical protein